LSGSEFHSGSNRKGSPADGRHAQVDGSCRQNREFADKVHGKRRLVVLGSTARCHGELLTSTLQSCTLFALGLAASGDWPQGHRCGRSIWSGRSVEPPHSELTVVVTLGTKRYEEQTAAKIQGGQ